MEDHSQRPDHPRVSIGLPVYNGEAYLAAAIDSVVNQSFRDWELIICDNASTDGTRRICREYSDRDPRIQYHRNDTNLGAAANYNLAFQRSRGEYFKWASHDDFFSEHFIARCVAEMDRDPGISLSFSRFDYVDESGSKIRASADNLSVPGETVESRIRRLTALQIESTDVYWAIFGLIRSVALRRTDLIAPYIASDQTLLFHLALMGKFHQVPETLFFRREHAEESMSANQSYRDRATWFDSSRTKVEVYLPNWRLIREHFALIHRERLSPLPAWRCYFHVVRRFAHKWRALGGEVKWAILSPISSRRL